MGMLGGGFSGVESHLGAPPSPPGRQQLPVLPSHLWRIRAIMGASPDPDAQMLLEIVTLTFFGFFDLGKLKFPQSKHLPLISICVGVMFQWTVESTYDDKSTSECLKV